MRIPALFHWTFLIIINTQKNGVLRTAYSPEGVYAACNATASGEVNGFGTIFQVLLNRTLSYCHSMCCKAFQFRKIACLILYRKESVFGHIAKGGTLHKV